MVLVTPFQQKKKQVYLKVILVIAILGIIFIAWYKYYLPKHPSIPRILPEKPPKININFDVLNNPILSKLFPFEEISPLNPEEAGRSDPFKPY